MNEEVLRLWTEKPRLGWVKSAPVLKHINGLRAPKSTLESLLPADHIKAPDQKCRHWRMSVEAKRVLSRYKHQVIDTAQAFQRITE